MSTPLRAVIIGCGPGGEGRAGCHSIGYAHAVSMRRSGGRVVLVAAATRTPKNAETFAAEFPETKMYSDYRDMLVKESPDLVSVCAFPPEREEMVMAALACGAKIVWAEKPFALTSASARRMIAAAKAANARIFVGFQRRYGAPFEAAYDAIHAGKIGRLRSVHIVHPWPKFIDFGPHLLDVALGWLSPLTPTRAFAGLRWSDKARYQGVKVEDQLLGTVHFEEGARLVVESGPQAASRSPILRADGDRGFLELLLTSEVGETGFLRGVSMDSGAISCPVADENFHHGTVDTNLYFDRQLLDMVSASETGAASRVDASRALAGIEIFEAFEQSARESCVVSWPL
jgi:predicted dehydrogenase